MSTMWNVQVIDLEGCGITLEVVRNHPDAGEFESDPAFALRMLYEPARELDDDFRDVAIGPLGDAATEDQVESESWARANAGRFVSSVTVEPSDRSGKSDVGGIAVYRIEMTDSRWLAHLREGAHWRSAAFI